MSDLQDPNQPATGTPKKPPRPIWQQIAYNAMPLILLAVAAAFIMPFVQEMMNPEPRRLTPLRGVTPPPPPPMARPGAPISAPRPEAPPSPTVTPRADPALAGAFGEGAIRNAARDAVRAAAIAVQASRCSVRDAAWLATLRDAVGPDIARRYNSYDGKPEDAQRMIAFVSAQFSAAVSTGATGPVQYDCADLPAVPEFRAADALVQAWRAARR